jgi:hypothetical protein
MQRDATPAIHPDIAYIAPINIIHPVYHPTELSACPNCASLSILWDGLVSYPSVSGNDTISSHDQ